MEVGTETEAEKEAGTEAEARGAATDEETEADLMEWGDNGGLVSDTGEAGGRVERVEAEETEEGSWWSVRWKAGDVEYARGKMGKLEENRSSPWRLERRGVSSIGERS